jgi:predicted DNA binding CopG/RHH family protein
MGFSDFTVLSMAVWHRTRLVTFTDPFLLPGLAGAHNLDEEEQKTENEIDQYVSADEEAQVMVRLIAWENRKGKTLNIRTSERDLSQIRERASREGVPYEALHWFRRHTRDDDSKERKRSIARITPCAKRNW